VSIPTEGNLAVEPQWRREVSTRLHSYRERRHGVTTAELQPTLPFEPSVVSAIESLELPDAPVQPNPPLRFEVTIGTPKQAAERYEISIPAHQNSATVSQLGRRENSRPRASMARAALVPVASLSERQRAALLDAVVLLFSYGGMLALFTVLGGRIGLNKFDLLVTGATLLLFYAQYFALFTMFGGSTPGMMVRGLRVVGFDGGAPTSSQMSWRSFGYVISAGTCFLGFLWALWDEDHLSWQDRISQTYVTPIEGFATVTTRSETQHEHESYR